MLHARYRSLWNIWMRSFEIYSKWSVQANKQASKQTYTHTRAQCSHASVGLAQARPNYLDFHPHLHPFGGSLVSSVWCNQTHMGPMLSPTSRNDSIYSLSVHLLRSRTSMAGLTLATEGSGSLAKQQLQWVHKFWNFTLTETVECMS